MTEIELYKIIAKNLKNLRKERKMSQEEFANYLNVGYYYYQRLEAPNTKQTMSLSLILDISEKLGINMTDLFTDKKED